MQGDTQKETVVDEAFKIAAVLNRHLDEQNCQHSIKQIMSEVYDNE